MAGVTQSYAILAVIEKILARDKEEQAKKLRGKSAA